MSVMSDYQRTTLKPSATRVIASIPPNAEPAPRELAELSDAADPLISAASPLVTLVYGKVLLVVLSLYISLVGIFEHLPMGSNYSANSMRLEELSRLKTLTHSKCRGVAERSLQCIPYSKIYGLNKQIVLQDDEAGIDQRCIAKDGLETLVGLYACDLTGRYLPI